MQTRSWLLTTIGLIVLAGAAIVALNVSLDMYGIYRDTHDRRLLVYGDDRFAKYLLSARYVPENFNAVLIGSSVSANWNIATSIRGLRVYNESLVGGNIVEGKCLLDQVFSKPGVSDIKVVFLIVQPFLTRTHGFETIALTPRLKLSALGSVSLWNAYFYKIKILLHRASQTYNEFGTTEYRTPKHELNPTLKQMMQPGTDFDVDAAAFDAYMRVIQEIHAHGARIVFIVPPISERLLAVKPEAFHKYSRLIQRYAAPEDLWVDFTSAPYEEICRDEDNFSDGLHMEDKAAAELVSMIAKFVSASSSLEARLEYRP